MTGKNVVINNYLHKANTIFLLVCLVLFGCTEEQPQNPSKPPEKEIILKIGLIPEQNIFNQINRYNHIGNYLKKKTGITIEFKALARYGDIVTDFDELGLDGAFFGSFIYAIAHSKLGVIPVARPQNLDGYSTYHGILFVRKDSGINGIKDMKGKIFAFVDKATTAGYLLPLAYFKQNGIIDYNSYFKKTYFTGTHEGTIYDVLDKHSDIGAAKNTVYSRLLPTDPRLANELKIITRSPDVPENALAMRIGLDEKIRNKIRDTLIDMNNDPAGKEVLKEFGALKFIETTNDDYESVYGYASEIGLDLINYNYTN